MAEGPRSASTSAAAPSFCPEEEVEWPFLTGAEAESKVSYRLAPGEKVTRCPYDPAHWIRVSRVSSHLPRCRRNYEEWTWSQGQKLLKHPCRFCSSHRMYAPELAYHQSQCSYKDHSEEEQLRAVVQHGPGPDPSPALEAEETWEAQRVRAQVKGHNHQRELLDDAHTRRHGKAEEKKKQVEPEQLVWTRASPVWKGPQNPGAADQPKTSKPPGVAPTPASQMALKPLSETPALEKLILVDPDQRAAERPSIQFVNDLDSFANP